MTGVLGGNPVKFIDAPRQNEPCRRLYNNQHYFPNELKCAAQFKVHGQVQRCKGKNLVYPGGSFDCTLSGIRYQVQTSTDCEWKKLSGKSPIDNLYGYEFQVVKRCHPTPNNFYEPRAPYGHHLWDIGFGRETQDQQKYNGPTFQLRAGQK